jgi:hypothetical protein
MLYTKRVTLVFLSQFVCTLSFVVYCLLIVINFAEMFHTNLTMLHHKRDTDRWLQDRCKEQEFVHHIRHHIDLCETVEKNALSNDYLVAVQMALDGLHLCGSYSCEKILLSLTNSLRLSIYAWIAAITIVLVLLPVCVLPLYRRWQRNLLLHENHLGANSLVPSVYIRDDEVYMHDVPFYARGQHHQQQQHTRPSHFVTEPRNRRQLENHVSTAMLTANGNAYLHDHEHSL